MSIFKMIKDIIRHQFVAGVLVVVPLILTYVVLRFLFESIDGILSPLIQKTLHYNIPGLGIIVTILLIILAGFFTRGIIGKTIYRYSERVLVKTPVIRVVYLAAKQLIEAVTVPQIKSFKEVVMCEYMRKGLYAIGFATARIKFIDSPDGPRKMVGVFVPSTPTPISGVLVFVAEDEIIPINITVEEAVKMLVSGGIVSPSELTRVDSKLLKDNLIEGQDNAAG
nr:DUF502 domain-containing protein [candidate division Zixibacteria bacterium]